MRETLSDTSSAEVDVCGFDLVAVWQYSINGGCLHCRSPWAGSASGGSHAAWATLSAAFAPLAAPRVVLGARRGHGGPLAGMAHLYKDTGVKSLYSDRKFMGGKDGWQDAIEVSTTLYIGNLSFYTTEEQVLTHSLHLPRRVVE